MKLSVCVVNYHSDKQLRNFLESFVDYRPDCLHELIVVNNGSMNPDFKRNLKQEFGDMLTVISPQKNIGFGAAQNRAVRKARGEYVFLANPDLEFDEGALKDLIEFAESLEDFGVIGPRLRQLDGEIQQSCRRFPKFSDLVIKRLGLSKLFRRKMAKYLMKDIGLEKESQVDWLVGAAMLMKKDRFLEMGGFDERFFLFFEDTDLCRRLNESGYDVWYQPEVTLTHSEKRLSERGFWPFKKVFWVHLASAGKYFAKWAGEGPATAGKKGEKGESERLKKQKSKKASKLRSEGSRKGRKGSKVRKGRG